MMRENVVPTPAARLESGTPLRVWGGVLLAPAAWVVQSGIDWYITAHACTDGTASWGPLSDTGVRLVLIATAIAAIAVGTVGLLQSRRTWREVSTRRTLTQAYGYGLTEYLSIAGVFISAVFLLSMVLSALPAVVVSVCERGR